MNNKEKYKVFCEEQSQIPVFSQYWWMQAVAQNDWNVLLSERNNEIVGTLVYYINPTEKEKRIGKAILTQNNGVYIKYPSVIKQVSKLDYEEKIMNDLIDQLEQVNVSYYEQNFHYNFVNWLPFYWRGYHQTTRYTYVIEDTSDLEKVRNGFTSRTRTTLNKIEKTLEIRENIPLEEFYKVSKMTFDRQQKLMPYTEYEFIRISQEIQKNHAGIYIGIYDQDGNLHSVTYFIWDNSSVYYLIGGADPIYRSSQAQSLGFYYGIKLAHSMKKMFDFEGSMLRNIEPAIRKFGGIQKPYFRIWKKFECITGIHMKGEE